MKYQTPLWYQSLNEQTFYSSVICDAPNKSAATWNIMKELTNKNRTPQNKLPSKYSKLCIQGRMIYLAEDFNTFIGSVSPRVDPNLSSNIRTKISITNPFFLFDVPEPEILSVVETKKNKNSFGHDDISITVIKRHINSIITPLSYIILQCI